MMNLLTSFFQGCRVYAVQAGGGYQDSQCAKFWQGLAYKTYGHHLSMSSFNNVFDFIMAIAYKEQGPEQLEVREDNSHSVTSTVVSIAKMV